MMIETVVYITPPASCQGNGHNARVSSSEDEKGMVSTVLPNITGTPLSKCRPTSKNGNPTLWRCCDRVLGATRGVHAHVLARPAAVLHGPRTFCCPPSSRTTVNTAPTRRQRQLCREVFSVILWDDIRTPLGMFRRITANVGKRWPTIQWACTDKVR